jgi:hypothetical protein
MRFTLMAAAVLVLVGALLGCGGSSKVEPQNTQDDALQRRVGPKAAHPVEEELRRALPVDGELADGHALHQTGTLHHHADDGNGVGLPLLEGGVVDSENVRAVRAHSGSMSRTNIAD